MWGSVVIASSGPLSIRFALYLYGYCFIIFFSKKFFGANEREREREGGRRKREKDITSASTPMPSTMDSDQAAAQNLEQVSHVWHAHLLPPRIHITKMLQLRVE